MKLPFIWGMIFFFTFLSGWGQTLPQHSEDSLATVKKLFEEKKFQAALDSLESLGMASPAQTHHAAYWIMKGRCLYALDKAKAGIQAMDKAIELEPDYYEGYEYRALMKMFQPGIPPSEVTQDIDFVLKHKPNDIYLLKIKGKYLHKIQDLPQALAVFQYIIQLDSSEYEARVYHASIRGNMGEEPQALEEFNQIIHLYPDFAFAIEERAFLYMRLEKYELAIVDFDRVLALKSSDQPHFLTYKAYTLNNRGYAKLNINLYEGALEDINHSIELLPTNAFAYRNRAEVYIHQGDLTKACTDLAKAKELENPDMFGYGKTIDELIQAHCK